MTMAAPARTSAPTVVVIDDDAALVHALKFRLELEGFQVRAEDDARAMLALGAIGDDVCLVIDYNLKAMTGLQLLARLRAAGVRAPAVLLATNPTASLRARAVEAGAPLVEKPLLSDALLAEVRRALAIRLF